MSLNDKRFERSDDKIQEFFRIMNKQFTEDEWKQIRNSPNLEKSLAIFFRFWTLKESFVKAHGTGLAWNLQRLSYKVKSFNNNQPICDSELSIDGKFAENWRFDEIPIDFEHWISTALKNSGDSNDSVALFEKLNCERILSDLTEFNVVYDENEEWMHFLEKIENKPF